MEHEMLLVRYAALRFLAAILLMQIGYSSTSAQERSAGAFAAAALKTNSANQAKHRLAIHVDDNDAKVMNLALNNARNVIEYYGAKGEAVAIEIVIYGPGLHMLRLDTSPVKQRIKEMSMAPEIAFAACGNTQSNMAKQEGKDVPIMSEARMVPSGVVRLMELQTEGYAYIRP